MQHEHIEQDRLEPAEMLGKAPDGFVFRALVVGYRATRRVGDDGEATGVHWPCARKGLQLTADVDLGCARRLLQSAEGLQQVVRVADSGVAPLLPFLDSRNGFRGTAQAFLPMLHFGATDDRVTLWNNEGGDHELDPVRQEEHGIGHHLTCTRLVLRAPVDIARRRVFVAQREAIRRATLETMARSTITDAARAARSGLQLRAALERAQLNERTVHRRARLLARRGLRARERRQRGEGGK